MSFLGFSQSERTACFAGMQTDGENQSDRKERTQHACAAVAEERQRHPFRRKGVAYDANVEHGLEKHDERHAESNEASQPVGRCVRYAAGKNEKQYEKKYREGCENGAQFFCEDRKNEVGVRFGQIVVLLHGLRKTHSP